MLNRICFIGASTTAGMGDEDGLGWAGQLSRGFPPSTGSCNLGIWCHAVFQIADRAAAECRRLAPSSSGGRIILGASMNEIARFAEDSRARFARGNISP
ncbi:MAG: hypothetical protein IOC90_03200 [Methylocystis sp.]|jgi:hypothetical protein|nr:hypothetical protein [Methylocystis sp.]MCA3587031.1 hypothetical protein [Methylocystis sp.]MCA3591322.1 hypothetical protein [Methylocystis sp.]